MAGGTSQLTAIPFQPEEVVVDWEASVYFGLSDFARLGLPGSPTNVVVQRRGDTIGVAARAYMGVTSKAAGISDVLARTLGIDIEGELPELEMFVVDG